jgi:mannose/fructose/N-acetylgalactosamine-specific phosphotransferase system component IID
MKGPQNIRVAYALRPILRKLYKNPQMTKFVDTYRQFFAVNIKRNKRTVKL